MTAVVWLFLLALVGIAAFEVGRIAEARACRRRYNEQARAARAAAEDEQRRQQALAYIRAHYVPKVGD